MIGGQATEIHALENGVGGEEIAGCLFVATGVAEEVDGIGNGWIVREDPTTKIQAPALPVGEQSG